MVYKAIDLNKTQDYILDKEKKSNNPTKWVLGAISASRFGAIEDMSTLTVLERNSDKTKQQINWGTRYVDIVKYGLKKIKNCKPLQFELENNEVPQAIIDQIAFDDIKELAKEIEDFNKISIKDAENLEQ